MPNKWEYRTVNSPSDQEMTELGELGWELVAVQGVYYVFKRAKTATQNPTVPGELLKKRNSR